MSTVQTARPTMRPPRELKTIDVAVDPQHGWASIMEQSQGVQDGERMGIREILCQMLVASVWEEDHGHVPKKG